MPTQLIEEQQAEKILDHEGDPMHAQMTNERITWLFSEYSLTKYYEEGVWEISGTPPNYIQDIISGVETYVVSSLSYSSNEPVAIVKAANAKEALVSYYKGYEGCIRYNEQREEAWETPCLNEYGHVIGSHYLCTAASKWKEEHLKGLPIF